MIHSMFSEQLIEIRIPFIHLNLSSIQVQVNTKPSLELDPKVNI